MNLGRTVVGVMAGWLLLSGGAQAQGRGGGAGIGDGSGATDANSGRENATAKKVEKKKEKKEKPGQVKAPDQGTGAQAPQTTGGGR